MSKATKVWLIVAASLILAGCLIFAGGMAMVKWSWGGVITSKYDTAEHTVSDAFKNITVITDTADIEFLPSLDGVCKVVCYEQDKLAHAVTVSDETLDIRLVDTRKWYDHISISWASSKITVYLPEAQYAALAVTGHTGDVDIPESFVFESIDVKLSTGCARSHANAGSVNISTNTGDISLEGVCASLLKLRTTTGDIRLSSVECEGDVSITVSTGDTSIRAMKCKNLLSDGSTGEITLSDTVATEKFHIKRSTGDVEFERCDAPEIYVVTDTGDVEGSLLSDKVFIVKTDTGHVNVPKTIVGGRCEITTDTGDIDMIVNK